MGRGKKSVGIAMILNAFVIPGAGHIYLGQRVKGILMMIATCFFIIAPIAKYAMVTSYVLNIIAPTAPNAAARIAEALVIAWPDAKNIVLLSVIALGIIWLYGIFDAFKTGNKKEEVQDV